MGGPPYLMLISDERPQMLKPGNDAESSGQKPNALPTE